METLWFAGFLFTIGYIDWIETDQTAGRAGWKKMLRYVLSNIVLFIFCLFIWPVILGVDVKKTMVDGNEDG